MINLRLTPILAVLLLTGTSAVAQMSLTPPGLQPPVTDKPKPLERPAEKPKAAEKAAEKPAERPVERPTAAAKKPAPPPAAAAKPAAPAPTTAAPPPNDPNVDLVYGAYERGQY